MFCHKAKICFLSIFLCGGLARAMHEPINCPILMFNSAAEFARAVREEQNGRLFDYIKAAACGAGALGCCNFTANTAPATLYALVDAGLATSAPAILSCGLFSTATAGLAYCSYKAFTRSNDYNAALRVARLTCPQCLHDKVLGDPNAETVLSVDIYRAILDALSAPTHAGLCMAHRPQQQMVF